MPQLKRILLLDSAAAVFNYQHSQFFRGNFAIAVVNRQCCWFKEIRQQRPINVNLTNPVQARGKLVKLKYIVH